MEVVTTMRRLNEIKKKNPLVFVYFESHLCGVCKDMLPKLEKLLEKYPEIKGVKVEVELSKEIAIAYSIFSAPAMILFAEEKETIREAGIISIETLEKNLSRIYEMFYESA